MPQPVTSTGEEAIRRARSRYRSETLAVRAHVRLRAATAPLAAVVDAVGNAPEVVEVGSGHGLVALALAEDPARTAVTGVDIDAAKVAVARRAAAGTRLPVGFEVVGSGWRPPPADAFVLADVLYLLDPAEQRVLLDACVAALRPGGTVVVKEVDDTPQWKASLARAQEQAAVRTVTQRTGGALAAPPARTVAAWLRSAGLDPIVSRHDRWRPWPHYLAVARSPGPRRPQ